MPPRLPVLIFDFGNVVAFFDNLKACEVLAAPLGCTGAELLERARAGGLDALVKHYELGQMADAEFVAEVGRLIGVDFDPDPFERAWSDIFTPNRPVIDLIERLHQGGYMLLLGSNTSAMHARAFRRQFADVLARFDHLVLSFEVGAAKPGPGFFAECARRAGVAPEQCLFIDDVASNVQGAQAAGLDGIVFCDVQALIHELRGRGVLLPE